MAEEPAAPEAKKSDTFQFPDGSKYGWPSHFPFLPPPRSFDHIALEFIGSQHFFAEGEYEEVAGQEEGSVKRVRQVTLLAHPSPLPLPLRHSLLCSKSANVHASHTFPCNAGVRPIHSRQRQCVRGPVIPPSNFCLTASGQVRGRVVE
jgi:hypothetical protein